MWCGGRHLHKECPERDNTTTTPTCFNCKLVDGEATGTPGRDAKEKVSESAQDCNGKSVRFQPHQPRVMLRGSVTQRHTATALSCTDVHPLPLRHNQQQVPSQSVQAPNANSSFLNDMFTVAATIFRQIMTELNGAKSEEGRILAITNIKFKLTKHRDCK
jgi:hypothetical protein